MAPDHSDSDIFARLRWFTASDPKQARAAFLSVLNGPHDELNALLVSASGPGDGRLRQMIATVFRTDPQAAVLEPWLRRWLEVEPDEFTKTAIESALTSRDPQVAPRPMSRNHAVQPVEKRKRSVEKKCSSALAE